MDFYAFLDESDDDDHGQFILLPPPKSIKKSKLTILFNQILNIFYF